MKWTLPLLLFMGCLLFGLLAFVNTLGHKSQLETAGEIIVMRNIAHKMLWLAGDSSSRVLPVKQISKSEFQVSVQTSFSFKPDSLVQIIDTEVARHQLPGDYVVNVLDCNTEEVVYGYAIFKSKLDNIVPCLGREQPRKKYCINIKFAEDQNLMRRNLAIAGLVILVLAFLLACLRLLRPKTAVSVPASIADIATPSTGIPIGAYSFFPNEQLLVYEDEKIVLTQKEAKLLGIFAAAPNQVIDRTRLQKEVWEDEGVIVGRSLDMFISKLRKKLENDSSVKLANIHGKGYKLEISS